MSQSKYARSILYILLFATSTPFFIMGCASTGKSVGAGALVGGAMGAGVGALADPGRGGANRFRNVVIGTAVGGAVGAGASFALGHAISDEKKESYAQGKAETTQEASSASGNPPKLLPARTEARWIPDQVHGTTFIPGHFEYVIIETARWESAQ